MLGRPIARKAAFLGAVSAGGVLACGSPEVEPAHRSLWRPLAQVELAFELAVERAPELGPHARVREVQGGVAVVDLSLRAQEAQREATVAAEDGPFVVYRWDLPLPLAPELLSRSRQPELAGLDLPRMVDPGVPLDGERGFFFVGPDERDGSPCLRIVLPEAQRLPESFPLRYPVEAARVAGLSDVAAVAAEELVCGRSVAGERTREAWVVPAGATLRVRLPEHGPVDFCTRLFAAPAAGARTVRLRVGGAAPVERVLLGDGGALPVRVPLEAARGEQWLELEVRGPHGSLLALEEPRLVRSLEERAQTAASHRPNVCLVIVDTLRADRLTGELMPRCAELARDSLAFEDCWSTCSWTLPSIATMLTSNHGGQHQAWLNDQPLPPGVDTLGEHFQRAGYRTAAFTDGVFVDQIFGLDRGFGTFDSSAGGVAAVTERALAWLDAAGPGPWFLLVHTYEVHAPYEPPPEAFERVVARHPGILGDRRPEPQAFHDERGAVDGDLEAVSAFLADLYDEGVRYADAVLGGFFDELRERDLYGPMVLALTSDHGEEFGEHGLLGHTDTLYREQLHVPLLLRLPGGRRAGERDGRPVSHLDLAPTLLAAAGLAVGAEATFEGHSLLGARTPSPIYATRHIAEIGVLRAMRAGEHAFVEGPYIFPRREVGPELYDLVRDPRQQRNLYDAPPGPLLRARLEELMRRYDAPKVRATKVSSAQVRLELQQMGYE